MLVDATGNYVTQRDYPAMSLIEPTLLDQETMSVDAPGMDSLRLKLRAIGTQVAITVWNDADIAIDQGETAANWFSQYLKTRCRLVAIGSEYRRVRTHNGIDAELSFSDHSPVVVAVQESLQRINQAKESSFTMTRFRPNIVISGCEALEEYTWSRFAVGSLLFDVIRVCDRCSIVSVEQETGKRNCPPLTLLPTLRSDRQRPVFGLHAAPLTPGLIKVNDPVRVMDRQENEVGFGF
jgi:uncharacterized protein YcbX